MKLLSAFIITLSILDWKRLQAPTTASLLRLPFILWTRE